MRCQAWVFERRVHVLPHLQNVLLMRWHRIVETYTTMRCEAWVSERPVHVLLPLQNVLVMRLHRIVALS